MIATYTYNALDQRIGIQESGSRTWTVYNGASADAMTYADFNGSGTLLTRYVTGQGMVNGAIVDELLARTSSGGTTAWYLTDKLDSVRDIVSSAGSVLDHVVYDSFGKIVTETIASNGDRFKFSGMEYDVTTGEYYDRARWYSSFAGRFTGLDPSGFRGGDNDLYRFATNTPTNAVDRNGFSIFSDLGNLVGQLGSNYQYYLSNPASMDQDLQAAQKAALTVAAVAAGAAIGGAGAAVAAYECGAGVPLCTAMAIGNLVAAAGVAGAAAGGVNAKLDGTDVAEGAMQGSQFAMAAAYTVLMGKQLVSSMLGLDPGGLCFVAGTEVLIGGDPSATGPLKDSGEDKGVNAVHLVAVLFVAAAAIPLVAQRTRNDRRSVESELNEPPGDSDDRRARRRLGRFRGAGGSGRSFAEASQLVHLRTQFSNRADRHSRRGFDGASVRPRATRGRRVIGAIGIAACLLYAALLAVRVPLRQSETGAIEASETRCAALTAPIETIHVGQRVLTSSAPGQIAGSQASTVDVRRWRRLRLRADNRWADGTPDVIEVETLQPPEWIEANHAETGSLVSLPLDLEEMGLRRGTMARVVANEPCPALGQGPGRAVLTTVNHLNSDVWKLVVEQTASENRQTIFPTGLHRFYSASRGHWVHTQDLEPGEHLIGIDGPVVVRAVTRIPGTQRVYNMTVEAAHTYRVSALGVLVHNSGCADPNRPPTNGSTPSNRQGIRVHYDINNGGTGEALPAQTKAAYPTTQFYFRPQGMKGPDVVVTGGDHPAGWGPGVTTADWKPNTPSGLRRFKYETKIGKLPPNAQVLPYDNQTEKLILPPPGPDP